MPDVRIECKNEFATVTAIALDDNPMSRSKKVLIQTMTVARPYGFQADGGKEGRITNVGSAPYGVENIRATVSFPKRVGVFRVTALDANGYAVDAKPDVQKGRIRLHPSTVYHVIQW